MVAVGIAAKTNRKQKGRRQPWLQGNRPPQAQEPHQNINAMESSIQMVWTRACECGILEDKANKATAQGKHTSENEPPWSPVTPTTAALGLRLQNHSYDRDLNQKPTQANPLGRWQKHDPCDQKICEPQQPTAPKRLALIKAAQPSS